jgi:Ribbon-helix-helix domain
VAIWAACLVKASDLALRSCPEGHGLKQNDDSRFIEEASRCGIFRQAIRDAREAFADVPPDELEKMFDETVEDIRAERYQERTGRS